MAEPFIISFTVDESTGHIYATLPNEARFMLDLSLIGGKLGANLKLHRDGVIAAAKERPFMSALPELSPEQLLIRNYVEGGGLVQKCGVAASGLPKGVSPKDITLDDIGL